MSPGEVFIQHAEYLPLALQQRQHQARQDLSVVISFHGYPRFVYTYTDGRGWPTYQYINSQSEVIYLHFYDEGLFYDGFYVINDMEVSQTGGGDGGRGKI